MNDSLFLKKASSHSRNINAFAVLCQCYHETKVKGKAWSSELFLNANNGAGIKAWNRWNGEVYTKVSWEQDTSGVKYDKASIFCKYPTVDSFIDNYVLKIQTMYPLCIDRKDNFLGYFTGLLDGPYKWATDREYFTRLIETSIELAPDVFGRGTAWRQKYLNALEYAVQKRYLTNAQQKTVEKLLEKKNVTILPIDNFDTVPRAKICIDAGHGGRDAGATYNEVYEKDVARKISETLGKGFLNKGYQICYTRVGDEYVSLSERANRANQANADILISIHCNSAKPNPQPHGWEIWTTKGQNNSDKLATAIHDSWVKNMKSRVRTDYSDGDPDKEANWTVLYRAKMPAVLIEMGFLSNTEERNNMMSPVWISLATGAIIEGVQQYLARG